ncbi:MAG: PilZ domain-containing protein [Desulforhopalus sp.]
MEKSEDRRVSVRMPFVSKGICHLGKINKKYSGTVRDVSITGLFLEMKDCPDAGCQCDIDIIFEGTGSRLIIDKVSGVIVRSEEGGVAVRFDERLEWFVLIPLYFHKMQEQSLQK